jgi:hypothetical protein
VEFKSWFKSWFKNWFKSWFTFWLKSFVAINETTPVRQTLNTPPPKTFPFPPFPPQTTLGSG